MGYIDRKINTYYNLYSARMMIVLSNNTNLERELNRFLIFMKNLDDEDREMVLGQLSGAHRLTDELLSGTPDRYSVEKVQKHF